ncbi:hypothetical protein KQI86_15200 [Clostridium sp. MSJ-11]|uniref:YokE-like PH domain-containing protein n=1 Tax=Clostridium mobile TaxID=2841512 RepID=A0ABS6EMM3_9CLOT|nr:hypothetical protein [Clostridium mobile]MBU5485665.1 hypothetical protein [Clostridium mobile]
MSRWLDEHDEHIEEMKEKTKNNPLILLGVIGGIAIALVVATGSLEALKVTSPAIVVAIVALLVRKKMNKKKGDPSLRESVEKYLTTPEEVEAFDREMYGEPKYKVEFGDDKNYLAITDNWMVKCRSTFDKKDFIIYKLDEIKIIKTITMKAVGSSIPFKREYHLQIIFKDNSEGMIFIESKKKCMEIKENLQRLLPLVEFWGA